MLERIEFIKNVGLLKDVNASRLTFKKATLIYADNGRGKSTFASILRSLGSGESALVTTRCTIDSADKPSAKIQFGSGQKVSFESGRWSASRPEILVFDNDFADRNVHSGGVVSTHHRRNLLEFALGEKAVSARKKEEETTAAVAESSAKLKQHAAKLIGFHTGIQLEQFKALPKRDTVDAEIELLNKRLVAATSNEAIQKKPVPAEIALPSFDLSALFAIFGQSLEGIHKDAEQMVRNHMAKNPKENLESWLSDGQKFDDGENCPYCGQSTLTIDVITAYRTHFNAAYTALKGNVARLASGIDRRTSEQVVADFSNGISTANQIILSWGDHQKAGHIHFDEAGAKAKLAQLKALLDPLAQEKFSSPPEAVGSSTLQEAAEALWSDFLGLLVSANKHVTAAAQQFNQFKKSLATEGAAKINSDLKLARLAKIRHSAEVAEIFRQMANEQEKKTGLEKKKAEARAELDKLMSATLGEYQAEINAILKRFGAGFSIESLNANYKGGSPRSEYGLKLRGKSISLEGGNPPFSTALSEGDKRTLAFAFFVASTLKEANLSSKIIVIDDPMCSFDLNRKEQTRLVMRQLFEASEQLIILAHDIYFLREVRTTLTKDGVSEVTCLQAKYAAGGYSDLDAMDFDVACEGKYFKNHRFLTEFMAGASSANQQATAKAVRPFLEGYLHRRFPGMLPKGLMFGQVIAYIKDADAALPIASAQVLVVCLSEINDYAGRFHHDTNPGDADTIPIVETELRFYVERALKVAYTGAAA